MSDSPIQTVLDHLKGIRRHEKGDGWEACCPAHEDKKPSLGVAVGDDGRVLLCCQAGCPVEAIVKALGLTMADLFPGESNGKPRIIAEYDYRDEAGVLRYQTVRFCPKDFRQRRPDSKGGWIWNLKGVGRLLYRLPELLASPITEPVFGCEGEKDVDNLRRLGLVATCNPLGAGKWLKCFNEVLRGRRVVLLPDNDEPGRLHMEDVRRQLDGVASSVAIVNLPDLPPKGDVSDWLDQGGTKHGLLEMAQAAENRPAAGPGHKPKKSPRVIPTYKPFPLSALPPILREYVDASAAAIGCDPALVALPGLAVVAGCIGNARAIRLKRGWTEPAVIWAVTVAPSGEQKSPAWSAAHDPMMAIQMELVDAAEEPTKAPCHITGDATIWSVGEILRDNSRGVLLSRDELDGWFQSFTRFAGKGTTDRPHWLELHRAGTLRVHRLTRARGPLSARRANCSICGTIQPLV
jgi:hypothetical protein